jgi:hypothetical protein
MSKWEDLKVTDHLVKILSDLHPKPHHFGAAFLTAYQLAIELRGRFPQITAALGKPVGGLGVGPQDSLARYLARELSARIKADPVGFPIAGAYLSSRHTRATEFTDVDGTAVLSSRVEAGLPTSLFRLGG